MNQQSNSADDNLLENLTENFILLHRRQFQAVGLPKTYWKQLLTKLTNEVLKSLI